MNKHVVFNGGPMSAFWWNDQETDYHNRFQVTLDHEVDPALLAEAWETTKRVYPLIDWVPDLQDGNIVFYEDERTNPPIRSSEPIRPGSDACGGRAFALYYCDRSIAMGAYHSVVDGGGISKVFCTMLYTYLSLYTGERDEVPPVELREGRGPKEYYQQLSTIELGEFDPQPLMTYPKRDGMFDDLEMIPNDQGDLEVARIRMPVAPFIASSRYVGANPSATMCMLMAYVAYALHPTKRGDLAFVLTMSAREMFGISDSIANCSANLLIPIEYEEALRSTVADEARGIRSAINHQRTADYIKTLATFYETYDWILAKRFAVLTYMGTFDLGMHTKHVIDFEMTDDATSTMYMIGLNGEFIISLQLGKVTDAYAKAMVDVVEQHGGTARIVSPAHAVARDVYAAE